MRKFTDYKPKTVDQMTQLLSMAMPQGRAWDAKSSPDTNTHKLVKSLATAIRSLQDKIYEAVTQWDVRITDDLILEWEEAVGIPDECRSAAEDIATRRLDVIDKLKKIPVITIADYVALAESVTGETGWNIRPGYDDFPADPLYLFVLLVTAPVNSFGGFKYPFGSGTTAVTTLTSVGTTATATVADTSTMEDGSIATISGATQTEYNGDYTITVASPTTFTYTFAGSGTSPATGTIQVNFGIDQTQVDALAANTQYVAPTGVAMPGYPFSGQFRVDVLRCVFRKVTPANVVVSF